MPDIICKDYIQKETGKGCIYYGPTKTAKLGFCNKTRKCTFFCHYSEKAQGKYTGNAEIATLEELKYCNT